MSKRKRGRDEAAEPTEANETPEVDGEGDAREMGLKLGVFPEPDAEPQPPGDKLWEVTLAYSPTLVIAAKDHNEAWDRYKLACGLRSSEHAHRVTEVVED